MVELYTERNQYIFLLGWFIEGRMIQLTGGIYIYLGRGACWGSVNLNIQWQGTNQKELFL